MDFRVLGLLEVREDGEAFGIGRGRESALLALVLLNANAPISTDRALDELWEGQLPKNAAKTVQIYISRLRQRLGRERIVTTPAGYLLLVEPLELDAARFERLASEGRNELEAGNAARADAVLSEALISGVGQCSRTSVTAGSRAPSAAAWTSFAGLPSPTASRLGSRSAAERS